MTAPLTIAGYHTKATEYFDFLGDSSKEMKGFEKLYFGVELELTASEKWLYAQMGRTRETLWGNIHPFVKDWGIATQDASVGYNGFELKTAPMLYSEAKANFAQLFNYIEDNKECFTAYGQNCGIHVHISRNALTPLQLSRLNMFINCSSTRDFIQFIGERDTYQYCNYKTNQRISDYKRGSSHTDALNIGAQTVELRVFKGTTVADNFFKNLEFVHAAVRFVHPDLCSDFRSVDAFKHFVKANRQEYPNLHTYICEGDLIAKRKERENAAKLREAKEKAEREEREREERVARRMRLKGSCYGLR